MPLFTTDEMKDDFNELARELYAMMGYVAEEGFDFTKSRHPTERLMYAMAEAAYDHFRDNGTFDNDED